jgi:hypothetical protein
MTQNFVILTYSDSDSSSIVPCNDFRQALDVASRLCENIDATLWNDCLANNEGRIERSIREWNNTASIGRGLTEGYRVTLGTRSGIVDSETLLSNLSYIQKREESYRVRSAF